MKTKLDYSKIDNVEVDNINMKDYPQFSDAFISYAEYKGKPMSEDELEQLTEDSNFLYEQIEWKIQ